MRLALVAGAAERAGNAGEQPLRHRAGRRAGGRHPGHAGGGHRRLPRVPAGRRARARRGVPRRHQHPRRVRRHRRQRRDRRDPAENGRVRPRVRRHGSGVPQQRAGVGEEHARETSVPVDSGRVVSQSRARRRKATRNASRTAFVRFVIDDDAFRHSQDIVFPKRVIYGLQYD